MKKFFPYVIGLLIVVVVGVGGYFLYTKVISPKLSANKYQAVFLSNGQVYFGKVSHIDGKYAQLTEIYYLITKTPIQQQTGDGTTTPPSTTPEYSLIKLGNELHGPADKMTINRDHILFIEELKTDGKVAKAISDAKNASK